MWLLSYQGKLVATGGTPATGPHQFIFTITSPASPTNVLWSEPQTVTVANGLFHVLLGQVTAFPANLFSGGPVDLKITVDGKLMDPPTHLSASPFAFEALHSHAADSATHADAATHATSADSATNAATVTNGVYITGSYVDPAWITSLSGGKITGKVGSAANADNAAHATASDKSTQADIANGISGQVVIGTSSLADGAVTTAKVAGGSIGGSQLANDRGSLGKVTGGIMTVSQTDDPSYTDNIYLPEGHVIGHFPPDTFLYKGRRMGNYTLGWMLDPDNTGADSAWLSGYGGIKLFVSEQPLVAIDGAGVKVLGNFSVTGTKSAVVDTQDYGRRLLYAVEAPTDRFTDEGKGKVLKGSATVTLDPIYLETVEGEYLVQLTPYGRSPLYVSKIDKDHFEVSASDGSADEEFSWRVSATRKGYTGVRLKKVDSTP